jgi:hypothetical protein
VPDDLITVDGHHWVNFGCPALLRAAACSFESRFKDAGDGQNLPLPLFRFRDKSLAAAGGKQVVLGAAIVFCSPSLRLHPACALKPARRRKQRTRIDAKYAVADLLNA